MGAGRVSESERSDVARREFVLPDVGEGLTEAEIVMWRVAVGDTVAVNDVLVEIETAKSVVELPSPFAGVVVELLCAEGATVRVGTPIIAIGDAAAVGREPTLVGYGASRSGPHRRRKRPADLGTVVPLRAGPEPQTPRRALAKPPVRKLAKDLGFDVGDVPASGPIVTRADVEAFAASRRTEPVGDVSPPARITADVDLRVPVRGVRKAMAETMMQSVRTAPQATEWLTVDASRTVELLERLKADRAFSSVHLTPTVVIAKAVLLALQRSPMLNASWLDAPAGTDRPDEVLMHGSVNLGVAVATERGLVVPTVKAAERLSMVELAREIGRLIDLARDGRLQPADQTGGTFTLTNVGALGVDGGTPILNLGESAILAVGAIQRRPWVGDDDAIVARWVTTLSVTFDHRIADGAEAARFLTDVGDILRDPATALLY